ncbi:TetR/AcrR family transcriptional regulator [Rubellicoccus peritrichatus]|uniref:TetR/AcrR family transcriptional regulator n=1 Tax=Rubellicoccus peritrichatus TaxID=3080537 RepID=A0AAQ3LGM6_9BACT|nr:TetR/AcrR family transcriptional regulator [Puniceicoccus sp. CR14]WOO41779.1 TetR/AcrR family transcriptional regulator [Puniceicoccus sp. CR14]
MAEKVFSQKGFVAAGISDVVHGLGISAGALYYHFPSKQALLEGIAERSIKKLCEQMDAWLEDEGLSPGEKMDLFFETISNRRRFKMKLARIDFGKAREDVHANEMVVQTGLEPISERLALFIEQGNATKEFKVQYPLSTAIIIFLMLTEFIHRSNRLEKILPNDEIESSMRNSINQLLMRKQ